jgi:hypothetical protein
MVPCECFRGQIIFENFSLACFHYVVVHVTKIRLIQELKEYSETLSKAKQYHLNAHYE